MLCPAYSLNPNLLPGKSTRVRRAVIDIQANSVSDDMAKVKKDSSASESSEIRFGDGAIDVNGNAYIASFLTDPAYEDVAHTRMWSYKSGKWLYHDLETTVQSVLLFNGKQRTGYALGRDGTVSIATPGGFRQEIIPDAGTGKGKYGYLNRIRKIGESLYACGHSGQIYRRLDAGWEHIDQGVLKPSLKARDVIALYDIGGTGEADIYVTGLEGILCFYDGRKWTHLDSPTNAPLERIECVSPREVYLAGGTEEEGLLYVGNHAEGWLEYRVETPGGFWGLTVFRGIPYVCSQTQLFVLKKGELLPIDLKLDPAIKHNRLVSNDDVMWSIGINDLAMFDGKKWARIEHLDAQ